MTPTITKSMRNILGPADSIHCPMPVYNRAASSSNATSTIQSGR